MFNVSVADSNLVKILETLPSLPVFFWAANISEEYLKKILFFSLGNWIKIVSVSFFILLNSYKDIYTFLFYL